MASVTLVLALVPLKNFPIDILMEMPFTQGKWPCPYKNEIPAGKWTN